MILTRQKIKKLQHPKTILVTRTDRMGDVLLATPVIRRLKELYPDAKIYFLVQPQWMSILQYSLSVDGKNVETLSTFDCITAADFKKLNADIAIVLKDESSVTRAIKKAKIPIRIGPYSTLRSFFCFNYGMIQSRSRCEMHEAEYNLQLLEKFAPRFKGVPTSWVAYSNTAQDDLKQEFQKRGLDLNQPYICMHPGSSGSARYLKPDALKAWLKSLMQMKTLLNTNVAVYLTGAASDETLVRELASSLKIPENHLFLNQSLPFIAELYRKSKLMIAHGTGPLHLAAAVGASVFAIFPPLYVLSERRWGPLAKKRMVWTPPDLVCPEKYRCRGMACVYFDCMDRFNVAQSMPFVLECLK